MELVRAERRGQARVAAGVPGVHVQPVDNAGDDFVPGLEQLFEPAAKLGGEDFLRVGFGDGGHAVGGLDGEGQREFFTPPGNPAVFAGWDAVVIESRFGARAHKWQVVHGEDGFGARASRGAFLTQLEQVYHQGGVPVVGVDEIRFPLQAVHHSQHGGGEKHILTPVGRGIRAVDRAVGDGFAANQVDRHTVHFSAVGFSGVGAGFGLNRKTEQEFRVGQLLADRVVIREQQARVDAKVFGGQVAQSLGQRAGNVPQAANFYQRIGFGGKKQDFEGFHTVLLISGGILWRLSSHSWMNHACARAGCRPIPAGWLWQAVCQVPPPSGRTS